MGERWGEQRDGDHDEEDEVLKRRLHEQLRLLAQKQQGPGADEERGEGDRGELLEGNAGDLEGPAAVLSHEDQERSIEEEHDLQELVAPVGALEVEERCQEDQEPRHHRQFETGVPGQGEKSQRQHHQYQVLHQHQRIVRILHPPAPAVDIETVIVLEEEVVGSGQKPREHPVDEGEGGQQQDQVDELQLVRQLAEKDGVEGEKVAEAVDHDHRRLVPKPQVHEAVVDVGAVRAEDPLAVQKPLPHHEEGIEDRDRQDEHRREDRALAVAVLDQVDRHDGEAVSEEEAAAVPHEDAGGVAVELQEAEDPPHERQADPDQVVVAAQVAEHPDGAGRDGGDPAGESVQAVKKVHRVDHPDDAEHRERDGEIVELDDAVAEQIPDVGELDPADHRGDQGRNDFAYEFFLGGNLSQVVGEAGEEDDNGAGKEAAQVAVEVGKEDGAQQNGEEDSDAAQARNGPGMHLTLIGAVEDPDGDRQPRDRRNQHQCGEHRGQEYVEKLDPGHGLPS